MGTRARINVIEDSEILVSVYCQYDGYPQGLGRKVSQFLCGLNLVNGLPVSSERKGLANGLGCLAAQLIGFLKEEPGNVYIRSTGPESHGEEFVYNVYQAGAEIWIHALEGSMTAFGMPGDSEPDMETIYNGDPYEFLVRLEKERKEIRHAS
jgi:hypothetical protein